MRILVESHAMKGLPQDVEKWIEGMSLPGDKGGSETTSAGRRNPPEPILPTQLSTPLNCWDVQTHKYAGDVVAKVSFLADLVSGTGKFAVAGGVQEAKRYRVDRTSEGATREIEIGVAVRLAIATEAKKLETKLSVPNLVAAGQLYSGDTRIGISVVGYAGPLGELLPAPSDLNVESYSTFLESFHNVQKQVFGEEGLKYLAPEVLSYEDPGTTP